MSFVLHTEPTSPQALLAMTRLPSGLQAVCGFCFPFGSLGSHAQHLLIEDVGERKYTVHLHVYVWVFKGPQRGKH